jgi:hypothetical protein
MVISLLRIAEEARKAFSAGDEEPPFAFVHDAHSQLIAAGKSPGTDPRLQMAAFVLADFGEHILQDLTRAIPWDQKASLRETRQQAMDLLRTGFELIENVDLGDVDDARSTWLTFFRKMGENRSQYELLVDKLNDQDRELLTEVQGV